MSTNVTQTIKIQEEVTHQMPSARQLMWRKLKKHKLAIASLYILAFIYLVALFGSFFAPFNGEDTSVRHAFAPPQSVRFIYQDENGSKSFAPHVLDYKVKRDPISFKKEFVEDPTKPVFLGLFVRGFEYKLLGIIPTDIHLFGAKHQGDKVFLFGADRLGRDILSRVILGTKISMSIGLVGVVISLVLGVLIGGISGYFGGWIDHLIQRVIEFLRSIPTIPLWMGLAAAIPLHWEPIYTYFIVTAIVSMVGWTGLAREVRGKFLSLRNEEYIIAARLDGLTDLEIIMKHMVPSFMSHIIASLTLAIPVMILAETSLSFLGIGLQPPIISWGVLLKEAQNIRTIVEAPWLLLAPSLAIVVSVLSMNFLGDGLRDASDPFSS